MAERDLRKISKIPWNCISVDGHPTDAEIQDGCQQRIADAQERIASAQEGLLEVQKRAIELRELSMKPVLVWREESARLGKDLEAAHKEVEKLAKERDILAGKVNIQRDGVRHLYRRISALKGVISRMKKA